MHMTEDVAALGVRASLHRIVRGSRNAAPNRGRNLGCQKRSVGDQDVCILRDPRIESFTILCGTQAQTHHGQAVTGIPKSGSIDLDALVDQDVALSMQGALQGLASRKNS